MCPKGAWTRMTRTRRLAAIATCVLVSTATAMAEPQRGGGGGGGGGGGQRTAQPRDGGGQPVGPAQPGGPAPAWRRSTGAVWRWRARRGGLQRQSLLPHARVLRVRRRLLLRSVLWAVSVVAGVGLRVGVLPGVRLPGRSAHPGHAARSHGVCRWLLRRHRGRLRRHLSAPAADPRRPSHRTVPRGAPHGAEEPVPAAGFNHEAARDADAARPGRGERAAPGGARCATPA